MTTSVCFDVQHLYYLPQYLPVAHALNAAGVNVSFVVHRNNDLQSILEKVVKDENLNAHWVDGNDGAFKAFQQHPSDWIIFGNIPKFETEQATQLHAKLALMQHGIGPKSCYYEVSKYPFDVRFVEGQRRLQRLQAMYPTHTFEDVGFAKLDPLFNQASSTLSLTDLGLDPAKPTLLYAPTFYPSSLECFPANWPKLLADYNLILKPHFFSLTKQNYKKQRRLLKCWASFSNVYLAKIDDYNLLPFMSLADLMISDASSAIFEFITLDKPVIWCDFHKLRWTYRGPFRYRLKQRLDGDIEHFHQVTRRAAKSSDVLTLIKQELALPIALSDARHQMAEHLAGKIDGQCSQRICRYLLEHA